MGGGRVSDHGAGGAQEVGCKVVVNVGVVGRTACWGLSGRGAVRPGVARTAGWVRGCRQLAGCVCGCRQLAER